MAIYKVISINNRIIHSTDILELNTIKQILYFLHSSLNRYILNNKVAIVGEYIS